jgi:hypothetical protein
VLIIANPLPATFSLCQVFGFAAQSTLGGFGSSYFDLAFRLSRHYFSVSLKFLKDDPV